VKSSEQCDKVSAALVAVAREVRVVGKSGNNSFDKYRYAKLEDYIGGTAEALAKNELTIITSASAAESLPERTTDKDRVQHAVRVHLTMRAVHSSGQWIEVNSIGEGQDRSDKGTYKAITGARKYGIACLLGLGTSDDPENDNPPEPPPAQRATPPKPDDKPASARLQLTTMVLNWSGVNKEDQPAALRAVAARCGKKWEKTITESDCQHIIDTIKPEIDSGVPFAQFVGGKQDAESQ